MTTRTLRLVPPLEPETDLLPCELDPCPFCGRDGDGMPCASCIALGLEAPVSA